MNLKLAGCAFIAVAAFAVQAQAHHSFAPYDMQKTKILTGVVTRVNPDANHLQIYFAEMNAERTNVLRDKDNKPIIWSVEMAGSAASAQDGISVNSFPQGTVFSVAVHPARRSERRLRATVTSYLRWNSGDISARVNPCRYWSCCCPRSPSELSTEPGSHTARRAVRRPRGT